MKQLTLSGSRWSLRPLTKFCRAESCLQVYLPCWRASRSGQIDSGCGGWLVDNFACSHREQTESTSRCHLLKLSGVGSVSICASSEKKRHATIYPPGRPYCTSFALSSSITPRAFDWMDISSNFLCISLDYCQTSQQWAL